MGIARVSTVADFAVLPKRFLVDIRTFLGIVEYNYIRQPWRFIIDENAKSNSRSCILQPE